MGQLINLSIDVTKIDKSKLITGKKGTYLNLTVSVDDEKDQYDNDASVYIQQSKEEREAGEKRIYLGNGRVIWSSNNSKPQNRKAESIPSFGDDDGNDLPF